MRELARVTLAERLAAVSTPFAERSPLVLSYVVWPDDFPSPTALAVLSNGHTRHRPLMTRLKEQTRMRVRRTPPVSNEEMVKRLDDMRELGATCDRLTKRADDLEADANVVRRMATDALTELDERMDALVVS